MKIPCRKEASAIGITTAGGVIKLKLDDFIYAESQQHYQYIHSSPDTVSVR